MNVYRGVIEDNNSPLKDGRVKVRIFGIHTPNNENSDETFNYVSTDDLPWAEVMQSMSFGFNSGVGVSSIPNKGTWVLVMVGSNTNLPIVIGAISGTNTEEADYSGGQGFCDPDGNFPVADRLNETDINRLARAEKIEETCHQTITDNLIDIEPEQVAMDPEVTYPNNSVIETKSGHVIEIDDTLDNERIMIFHKSGSYCEFKPDGTVVVHSQLDSYEMIVGSKVTNIGVDDTTDVGGARVVTVIGDETLNVDGSRTTTIGGDDTLNVDGSRTTTIGGDDTYSAGSFTFDAGTLVFNGNVRIDGNLQVTGDSGADGNLVAGGDVGDAVGKLSGLRDAYGQHMHTGNMGAPTPLMIPYIAIPLPPVTVS